MSITPYIRYNTTTGKIIRIKASSISVFTAREPVGSNESEYLGGITGSDGDMYFVNDLPVDRPEFDLTITGGVITGIPNGTSVIVTDPEGNGGTYTITDGEIDFTGSSVGTYQATFTNFPYMDKTMEVTV